MNDPQSEFNRLIAAIKQDAVEASTTRQSQDVAAADALRRFHQKVLAVLKPVTNQVKGGLQSANYELEEFGGVGSTHYTIAWAKGAKPSVPLNNWSVSVDLRWETAHVEIRWKEGMNEKKVTMPLDQLQSDDFLSAVNAVLVQTLRTR